MVHMYRVSSSNRPYYCIIVVKKTGRWKMGTWFQTNKLLKINWFSQRVGLGNSYYNYLAICHYFFQIKPFSVMDETFFEKLWSNPLMIQSNMNDLLVSLIVWFFNTFWWWYLNFYCFDQFILQTTFIFDLFPF